MLHYSSITMLSRLLLLSLSLISIFGVSSTTSYDVRRYHLHNVRRDDYKDDYARPMLRGSGRTLAGYEDGYGGRPTRNLAEQATNSSVLLLAPEETTRKDPLNDFELYTGGWNITSKHYWASVGFTAVPFFALSLVWFFVFGISLCCLGICCCCCRKDTKEFSIKTYTISIVFLVIFLVAAIAGSTLLYVGDGNLNKSTVQTFNYIIERVDMTARKLMDLSDYLVAAKNIDVDSAILPDEVRKNIDNLETNINTTSYMLGSQTLKNSIRIEHVMGHSGLSMNLVAGTMLALAFLGLLFSILGCECLVYVLVILGWILVTSIYISCGVFLLFHNAIADTCIAMNEWVEHPAARTAMDHITPCVDKATAEDTLSHTKDVTYQLVIMVNGVLSNVSNANVPLAAGPPAYFNQSGPNVPLLCNPFNSDLSTRRCASGEVNLSNASTVWKKYTCEVSSDGICTTQGRLTPDLYTQNVAAANVSFGLYHYGSFLVSLGDCTFIRETLSDVTKDHCPGLMRYTQWVYIGSVLLGYGVMLSVILWMVLARQSKRRARRNQF